MSYAATLLLKAQAFMPEIFERKFERRRAISQIAPIFFKGQDAIPVTELARIKSSINRPTEILYKKRKDFTITMSTNKGVAPAGETGSTAAVPLTFYTDKFEVLVETKKYANQQISQELGFSYDLLEAEASYWFGDTGKEKALATWLIANRTQINVNSDGNSQNTWKATPDFFMEVAKADIPEFPNYLIPEMNRNKYSGMMDVITDLMYQAPIEFYKAQGSQNATNYSFQYKNINFANSAFVLPSTSDYKHRALVIPEGGVAMVTWNEAINMRGEDTGENFWGTYRSQFFPQVSFDVFAKREAKQSSTDYQDLVINYEFSLTNAIIMQPLTGSASGESVVYAYQMKKA